MSRQPRLDQPGLFYHVIARGIERCRLFRDDRDYSDFVRRMAKIFTETGTHCFAWSLMPNHIHLLLMTGLTRLGKTMQRLLTGYAVCFNLRRRRVGHLFQNRYKAIICQDDPYFLQLVRYIHLNHVRAGLIKTPEELAQYPWTGHGALMGVRLNRWQNIDEVLGRFGSHAATPTSGYERFIVDGWNEGHREELEGGGLIRSLGGMAGALQAARDNHRQLSDVRVLGDGNFVQEVLRQAETAENQQHDLQTLSLESLAKAVAHLLEIAPESIQEKRRDREASRAKSLVLYAATEWLGRTLKQVAGYTRISLGCASRARLRGKSLADRIGLAEHLKRQQGNSVP